MIERRFGTKLSLRKAVVRIAAKISDRSANTTDPTTQTCPMATILSDRS